MERHEELLSEWGTDSVPHSGATPEIKAFRPYSAPQARHLWPITSFPLLLATAGLPSLETPSLGPCLPSLSYCTSFFSPSGPCYSNGRFISCGGNECSVLTGPRINLLSFTSCSVKNTWPFLGVECCSQLLVISPPNPFLSM